MVARVLQLVNGGFFGLAHKVTSLKEAVAYLGMDTIKNLALATDTFTVFTPRIVHCAISVARTYSAILRGPPRLRVYFRCLSSCVKFALFPHFFMILGNWFWPPSCHGIFLQRLNVRGRPV